MKSIDEYPHRHAYMWIHTCYINNYLLKHFSLLDWQLLEDRIHVYVPPFLLIFLVADITLSTQKKLNKWFSSGYMNSYQYQPSPLNKTHLYQFFSEGKCILFIRIFKLTWVSLLIPYPRFSHFRRFLSTNCIYDMTMNLFSLCLLLKDRASDYRR